MPFLEYFLIMKHTKQMIQKSKTKKSKTDFKSIEDELDAELDKM